MKKVLNRALGKKVYLFLPYGFAFQGVLQKDGKGFAVYTPNFDSFARFAASDIESVNKFTGLSFGLKGCGEKHLAKI